MRRAVLVMALILSTAAHPQATSDHIAGRVLSAADSHPLPAAHVTLVDTRTERLTAETNADAEGRFHFEPVPAGKYRLTGNASGFTSAAYQSHDNYSTAIVTGAGLPVDALELRLTPLAHITGRVLDETGDPIQRAQVTLYREDPTAPTTVDSARVTRIRNAQTDEDGEFDLERLPAGRYFLSATGTPWYAVPSPFEQEGAQMPYRAAVDPALDVAYPMTFYPHALDSAEASPIPLHGGEQLNLTLQLHAEHAVTLSIRTPRTAPGEQNNRNNQSFPQLTRNVFGLDEPVNTNMDGGMDVRRITGLAPGRYSLRDITNGSGLAASQTPLDLSTASTTMDMPAAADLATVTATVHTVDNAALPNEQFSLARSSLNGIAGQRINDKGIAEVANVPPGDYRLMINGQRRMNVVRLTVAGKVVPDKRLRVTNGGSVSIDVLVSPRELQIEGFAHMPGGKAAPATQVILVPAGADTDATLFRRDQTDLDGSFSFAGVIPGNYILIAIDDSWDIRWTDLPTLAPYLVHGVPVAVPPTGATHIQLPEPVTTQPR